MNALVVIAAVGLEVANRAVRGGEAGDLVCLAGVAGDPGRVEHDLLAAKSTWTSGLYPGSPTAPGCAAAGGNPAGDGVRTRVGEKSTVAGKSMPLPVPICELESFTAAVPAA